MPTTKPQTPSEPCPAYQDGKHRMKMIDFDEKTFVGKFQCRKCPHSKTKTAGIVCMESEK